jgi:hypothetical protein
MMSPDSRELTFNCGKDLARVASALRALPSSSNGLRAPPPWGFTSAMKFAPPVIRSGSMEDAKASTSPEGQLTVFSMDE